MIQYFDDKLRIDGQGCVGLWFQGLLGDAVLASTCFDHILRNHPTNQWIIVHSYLDPLRVNAVAELLEPFFASGRIRAYVYHYLDECVAMPATVAAFFEHCEVTQVHDLLYDRLNRSNMSSPNLGLNMTRRRTNKAVLCRRSTWNPHFPQRNRPRDEWRQIEQAVADAGYTASVVGIEDDLELAPGVVDRRGDMSIREVLDFTTDAALVVSCTTFIPVFTQYICPTLVICDPRDHEGQLQHWRMTEQYQVHPASDGYLEGLLAEVPPWSGRKMAGPAPPPSITALEPSRDS